MLGYLVFYSSNLQDLNLTIKCSFVPFPELLFFFFWRVFYLSVEDTISIFYALLTGQSDDLRKLLGKTKVLMKEILIKILIMVDYISSNKNKINYISSNKNKINILNNFQYIEQRHKKNLNFLFLNVLKIPWRFFSVIWSQLKPFED